MLVLWARPDLSSWASNFWCIQFWPIYRFSKLKGLVSYLWALTNIVIFGPICFFPPRFGSCQLDQPNLALMGYHEKTLLMMGIMIRMVGRMRHWWIRIGLRLELVRE